MKTVLSLAVALSLSMTCEPSSAGMEHESRIDRAGLFFAHLPPYDSYVLVYSDSYRHVDQLAKVCNAGRDVYSLERGTRYRCRATFFTDADGKVDLRSAALTVQGPSALPETDLYGLFSVSPPRTTRWSRRSLSSDETTEISNLLRADPRRFQKLGLRLRSGLAVFRPGSDVLTFVVAGRVFRDDETGFKSQRHHVFVRSGGALSYRGEIPAAPEMLVDVDGDDLPEIVTSVECDGWCISLWRIDPKTRRIGRFGGH